MVVNKKSKESMLKFFRSIRQKLLVEGSFRKYLGYAIGEILLVVIGILIALQINNWNDERKLDVERIKINENLLSEFELCKVTFEHQRKLVGELKGATNKILSSTGSN